MKKRVLIFGILVLILACSVLGAHTTSVSVNPTSSYETLSKNYALSVTNPDTSTDIIKNVTIFFNNFTLNNIYYSPSGWSYTTTANSVTFYGGSISPWGSQGFGLNLMANQATLDTPNIWNINTIDNLNGIFSNSVTVTTLNDANPPVLSNPIPQNNSFVQGTLNQFFSIDAVDAETGINSGTMEYCVHTPPGSCLTPLIVSLDCSSGNVCKTNLDLSSFTEAYYAEFKFHIKDNANNEQTAGWYQTQIDRTKPILILITPTDSILTNIIPTAFSFTATDNLSPTMSCNLNINGVTLDTQIIDNDGLLKTFNTATTYYDTSILNYPWNVECTDLAGNSGSASSDFSLIIDTIPPEININLPVGWYTGTIAIPHTETDDYQLDTASCEYNYNGNPWVFTPCNSDISFDTTNCVDGANTCTINVRASDTATNQNSASITFSVDNSAPTIVTIILSENPTKSGNTITITSDAADPEGLSDCILTLAGTTASLTNCNGNYLIPSTATGVYTLSLKPINLVGLSTELTTPITIDNDVPIITLTNPNNNSNTNGGVDFNYTTVDLSGISSCSLYIKSILSSTNAGVDFVQTPLTASNDPQEWYIICIDGVGNSATSSKRIVYYDTISPTILDPTLSRDCTTAIINWNTDEFSNSLINYSIDLSFNKSVSKSDLVVNHTLTLSSLAEGTLYYYTISSADFWGNIITSTTYNFTTSTCPSGGGGGGGGGGTSGEKTTICKLLDFNCGEWTDCQGTGTKGSQSRTCTLKEGISCTGGEQPISLRECAFTQEEIEAQNNPTKGLTSITGFSIMDNLRSTPAIALMVSLFVILTIAAFYRWLKGKGNTIHY